MKVHDNQLKQSAPIRRTREEKERILSRLKADLASMPDRASPALRQSLKARIVELEGELAQSPKRPPRTP